MRETSLATMILERADRYGSKRVMLGKRHSHWETWSWQALGEKIVHAAHGLAALGFRAGDRLAILAENRPEWAVLDLACLFLGGVDVPLYLTSSQADMTYILKDSGASFIAVSGREQLAKILNMASDLSSLSYLLLLDEGPQEETKLGHLPSLGFNGLLASGERQGGLSQPVADPGLATIIYTSGTTGIPKGVMLTHTNMLANTQDATAILPITAEDLTLSFLPLSHGFERTAGLYTILRTGACIAYGGGTTTILKDLGELKPTLFCCVPRVLELVYRRLLSERDSARFPKHQLLQWALKTGIAVGALRATQQPLSPFLTLQQRLADRLVFHKLRALLGGHIRFLVSGGAPLSAEVARLFYGLGVTVYEGYGLTEAGPVVACNFPGKTRLGTVGPALPQVAVTIAADGEICARGPNIMQGYYHKPEETAQTIDTDGWLHTGDLGTIDTEGFITITDRKKDLIITSNGENVAPQPIESLLKQDPLIEEACLIGDKRPYLTALLVPNRALLEALARKYAITEEWELMLKREEFRTLFRRRIEEVNRSLPTHARIHRFAVLAKPLSQDQGELTPTLKVKRREVIRTRRAEIEALYPSGSVAFDPSVP